jgi:hypothetical protein
MERWTMQRPLEVERTADAMAEVFWLAFKTLSDSQRKAVLHRLQNGTRPQSQIIVKPVHILATLQGLVELGGDAVEDTERYYSEL